jgi:hypothetical protein
MPDRITNANDALLPEIVHKHRVQRSASMTDIGKSIQDTDAITTSFVIIQKFDIFGRFSVSIDKSDRVADLPYSVVTKMASVRELFLPDRCSYMD